MNEYFSKFPVISYGNNVMYNITERTAILNSLVGNQYAFYPYTVKNGMPAWQVADKYYGDPDLVWLVYLSNNIIDPYAQWPKSDSIFNDYITDKYGSIEAAQSKIAFYRVNWYEDDTVLTVDQYKNLLAPLKKYWIPEVNQNGLPVGYARKQIDYKAVAVDGSGNEIGLPVDAIEAPYWSSVSCYDVEDEDNANKAQIRLLDSRLSSTAITNLKDLLN